MRIMIAIVMMTTIIIINVSSANHDDHGGHEDHGDDLGHNYNGKILSHRDLKAAVQKYTAVHTT